VTENAQVYIGSGDGWTHIGETDGPIRWEPAQPELEQKLAFPDLKWPLTSTVTIKVDATQALDVIGRAIGAADLLRHFWDNPGSHSHCLTCHPEQDRRPLAVDGHEHNRRRLARQRRKHR
jgi:hypothetical protein